MGVTSRFAGLRSADMAPRRTGTNSKKRGAPASSSVPKRTAKTRARMRPAEADPEDPISSSSETSCPDTESENEPTAAVEPGEGPFLHDAIPCQELGQAWGVRQQPAQLRVNLVN